MDAAMKRGILNADDGRPLFQAKRPVAMRNHDDVAAIVGLLIHRDPVAILGAVWSRGIDAVNLVLRGRGMTHILQPCREGLPPPVANMDAERPVPAERGTGWVVAPLDHCIPTKVEWVAGHPVVFALFHT